MRRVLLVLVLVSTAAAEPRHTTEQVQLHKKPGEKEAVVATLPANTEVTVIAEDGRWVKVRAHGSEGYLARTQLDTPATPEPSATAWSTQLSEKKVLGATASASEVTREAPAYTRPPRDGLDVRATAGLGYRLVGMDMTANVSGGLASYLLDADAIAAQLAADAALPLASRVRAIGDVRVELGEASPGITYPGPSGMPGKIPFQTFAADAGARLAFRAHDAIELAARAGFHYDAFLPTDVNNVGSLPREALVGATLGARVEIAPPHSRFSAAARFDWLAVGSRSQTPGLQDGTSSSAHAWWGGASVVYTVTARWSLYTAYDFGRATTSWSGMSERVPSATSAQRVDTTQLLQLGVGAAL